MHYILVARHDRFWLVGPFDSNESAGNWGRDPVNNPSDDPRWQTIELADAGAPVEVIPPDRPMAAN
jgi:hypothetical protein